ncbi:MAG TPA: hypothetical protein VF782_12235 [Allosphingosinicella sp.]|jgi:hypothetical protein
MPTDTMRSLTAAMTDDQKVEAMKEVGGELPDDKKKEVAISIAGGLFGEKPSARVRDILYLMVIGALVLILLACAGVITGVLDDVAKENIDKVVGLFTTVLSFIVGLFVPSPVANK